MGRYILHYEVESLYTYEPPDKDEYEYFTEEEQMHDRVNELAAEYRERLVINLAAYLQNEYKYNPVEIITKYKPEKI